MNETDEEEEQFGALLARLQDSVEANPDDPSLHFDIGLLLWERGGESKGSREKGAEHFVISAKLNPHNGAAFKYLGHYYNRVSVDAQRALKCYQRAVTLTPGDSESGESLCDLLDAGGKESLEVAVCREASEKSPRAFWAFRRLGYLQIHHKKWSEAVQSLQHAIRGYPTCAELWEALGLAYQRLGMYTASLKSYGRAIELEVSRVFSLIESGNILLMTGSFRKGIEQFQLALEISPHSVAAHYGLASALLGLSKECINVGAFRWAASLLEEASQIVKASTHLAGNISCIWKLQGDIQITYAKCFPWMDYDIECDKEILSNSIHAWKQICLLAAISARSAYQRALHLAPWQANIYADIAITSNLISSLHEYDTNAWQLSEKMALGALLLEGDNYEFWVALGCLSDHSALKQHALIRGLQLDVSSAVAWAYLGQLYRGEDKKQLARQAFDCARSIDPSLALPWAGMSADFHAGDPEPDEAFESCLRAVQILPLAEFQIGLAKIALLSGNLSSPQVYGAIQQAVQRAPHHPESHNLKGLVCEARFDYQSATAAYKLARCAISISSDTVTNTHIRDISTNLARSLSKAGHDLDALRECEDLQKRGMLDAEGLQIYALSLWKLGKNNLALGVVRNLAASISGMEQTSLAASVSFICRLLYFISGLDSAIVSIQKMPKEMFNSSKVSFIVSAIHALDRSNQLESVVSNSRYSLVSHEEITRMHFLIAIGKLIKNGSENSLGFQSGIGHLRKALHMYPNSNLIRNLLGYLLLSSKEWNDAHVATRCCFIDTFNCQNKEGLKSAGEIFGAGAVACYAIGCSNPMFTFPTCEFQCLSGPGAIEQLQKCLRREPWNHNISYLLVLNLVQKAREEKFPQHLCTVIKRLILVALSSELYSSKDEMYQYQKFQLLLCASEINLQTENLVGCISHAKNASALSLPASYLFFAHLLLCRAFASEGNRISLEEEYMKCMELKTEFHIGWVCLMVIESQYKVQIDSDILGSCLPMLSGEMKSSWKMWVAVLNLVKGLISLWSQDFLSAEEFLSQACSSAGAESCLFLCHGAICMELARQYCDSHFLSLAGRSLAKAQRTSLIPLPIVSALLAQAEGSLGSKEKWEKNLRLEWYTWSPEMRPAELFFQMHLLAKQIKPDSDPSSKVEACQSPYKWILRAIHTNPSCLRYWEALQKTC